ncbi:MAG TPA: hypothetical protein DCY93_03545 [Firmicutes bacterium]|nr:hypothetical protein [Bacillota bacterium]
MNIYKLKIKEKFIQSIREGRKLHEYRLGTPERRRIKTGDVLVLISNQNKDNFVKVLVESIEEYPSWDEALAGYWKNDFPGFNSIEDIKTECGRFYQRDEVREYGIIVFKISVFNKEVRKSKVLLDTNIVIHRESSNNVAYEVLQLYKLLDSLKVIKYVHEDIKVELSKYKDDDVKNVMLAKIGAYNILSSLKIDDLLFESVVNKYSKNDNSDIDNKFLYQIYKGKVDYFITEDRTLLQKAKDLYLEDVVLSTADFLRKVENDYPSLIEYSVLSVKLTKIGDIDVSDSFFDTLREDYDGIKFNNWFNRKSNEDAYIFKNKTGLQGFLYLKIENKDEPYNDIEPIFKPAKRLKVGTFKVNSTGLRLGERFIKIIIDNAIKSKVDEIYVTMFENKRSEVKVLMKLMVSWGFAKWGYKSNGELVLVKKMKGYYDDSKDPKFNYPFTKENIKYGLLPIESQWHTDLFPDLYLRNENMALFEERPCNYAIEKIYVCKGIPTVLSAGDIMTIYRMGNRYPAKYYSVATGYCIIQEIRYPKTYDEFMGLCSNKSVFTKEQLYDLYFKQQRRTIIKLLYVKSLERKVIYGDMLYNNIINEADGPRLSTIMSKDQFNKLLEIGKKGD